MSTVNSEPTMLILVRPAAEIAIKSPRTRRTFQQKLQQNLNGALARAGIGCEITGDWSRLFVRVDSPAALAVLTRVFGVGSFAPVERITRAEPDEIPHAAEEAFAERLKGKTFAVRVKRTGQHTFTSPELERLVGAQLGRYAKVNLRDPEVTVRVEVRHQEALLFTEHLSGPGGLPTGTEGHALALISGGYDSAVASWYTLKRGVTLDYVFFNLAGDAYERSTLSVVKRLYDRWTFGHYARLHVVDFSGLVADIQQRTRPGLWQVMLKRLMLRAASMIAAEQKADALVMGDALGQVSSQTLRNLAVVESAANLPVLRPLVGFDKTEIIEKARMIGTAALSEKVREYCAITPSRPVVAAKLSEVAAEERKLQRALLEQAVLNRKVLELAELQAADLVVPYVFTEGVPQGAVLIDCQSEAMYLRWHAPGARHWPARELIRRYRELSKGRVYVLYCAHGTQTAHIAEVMQREGYEAYSFRGGVAALRDYLEKQGLSAVQGRE